MQPFLGRQTINGAVIASFSSITMRAPGTSATPKGSVTRNSFVSPPSGSISRAIKSFWPDARWPSEAVKQTSLVLSSDDCSVRPLEQYLAQGEEISCTCCWPLCTVSPCAVGTGGFVGGCSANACGPTERASATIASVLNTLVFAAADAVRYVMRGIPLVLTAPWRNDPDDIAQAVRAVRRIKKIQTCAPEGAKTSVRIAAHACCLFFLREPSLLVRFSSRVDPVRQR